MLWQNCSYRFEPQEIPGKAVSVLSESQKKSTFFGGAAILAVGSILVKLIGAVYKIPLFNILSNEATTDFNTAYNVYNFFLTISTAGLPVALSKTVSEANALNRQNQVNRVFSVAFRTFLVLGLVSLLAMSVFGGPLASAMGDSAAVYCVQALSPSVLCVCIMASFRGYYQGHSNMMPTAVSQIIEASCKLVFGLALAFLVLKTVVGEEAYRQQMAAAGAIAGVSVGSVIALGYMVSRFWKERRRKRNRRYPDRPESRSEILRHLLRLAIPITLGSAAVSIVTIIDTRVVLTLLKQMYTEIPALIPQEAFQQSTFTPVEYAARGLKGIYDKCMAIYNLPSQLMVAITASVIPSVSACLARGDRRGASRTAESALRIGVMLCLPMGIGLFSLAGPILDLLYPGKLDSEIAPPIMATLGLAAICVCIMLLSNSILQAYDIVNLPVFTVAMGGIIKIIVNYVLVGNYDINIKGAPIGTLCCFAAASAMNLFFISRAIPHPPRYRRVFLKPLAASIVMGLAAKGCYILIRSILSTMASFQTIVESTGERVFSNLGNAIATGGGILTGVIVYAILILTLKAISPSDLALMPKGDKLAKWLHIQ